MRFKLIFIFLSLFSLMRADTGMSRQTFDAIEQSTMFVQKREYSQARSVLQEQVAKVTKEQAYDLAFLYNALAFVHIQSEDYNKAIEYYKQALSYGSLAKEMESSTLHTIAQLSIQTQNYKQSIMYLEKYHLHNEITASTAKLMMISYSSLDDAKNALKWVEKTIELSKVADLSLLQNRLALEQQLNLDKRAIETLHAIVENFKVDLNYFKQLSYLYQKMGDEKQSVAILESAYQIGLLKEYDDLMLLAQLLHYQGASIKAVAILKSMPKNDAKEEERLEFLSSIYIVSQERESAIEVLKLMYERTKKPQTALLIAQLYADMREWSSCETYAQKSDTMEAKMVLALAYVEQKKYPQAKQTFETLLNNGKYAPQAKAWLELIASYKQ